MVDRAADPVTNPPFPFPFPFPSPSLGERQNAPLSMELVAKADAMSAGSREAGILIPFGSEVGAAAFWRDGRIYVVFDERRPIDVAVLRELPAFAGAVVRLVANGTVLEVPAPRSIGVVLARETAGWSIKLRMPRDGDRFEPIRVQVVNDEMRLEAEASGRIVTLVDPSNGGPLLVGTLRTAHAASQTVRQTPEFGLAATFMGVLVEPVSDRITLRAIRGGFVVGGGMVATLALSGERGGTASEGRLLSRSFDFPPLETEGLLRRLQAAQIAAATAPSQTRTARRVEVAQAFLALGLGVEAQSILSLIDTDDVHTTSKSDVAGLRMIAAVIAARFEEAGDIAGAAAPLSDELTLWRGLLIASRGDAGREAAVLLAATYPILLDYPAPLRDRMLPLVADVLSRGSEMTAARTIVAAVPSDPRFDLARAAIARTEAGENNTAAAIQILEHAAVSPDRRMRSRAIDELVELKLATHALSPHEAADQFEHALYSWRGDELELKRRVRLAQLRSEAGEWRQAISMLRDTVEIWPDRAKDLAPGMMDSFARAIAAEGDKALSPFELVALAADNGDLLPTGTQGQMLVARIADQLDRLELPGRSNDVLGRLLAGASDGLGRAEIGVRIAVNKLLLDDPAGALDALNVSTAPELPLELQERRMLAFARAAAASGDLSSALSGLATLDTRPALQLRATLLGQIGDWSGAVAVLRGLVDKNVPRVGAIDRDGAALILELASAAARGGNRAERASVRAEFLPRLGGSGIAKMLDFITAEPIEAVTDFDRATREALLARATPEAVRTLTR